MLAVSKTGARQQWSSLLFPYGFSWSFSGLVSSRHPWTKRTIGRCIDQVPWMVMDGCWGLLANWNQVTLWIVLPWVWMLALFIWTWCYSSLCSHLGRWRWCFPFTRCLYIQNIWTSVSLKGELIKWQVVLLCFCFNLFQAFKWTL